MAQTKSNHETDFLLRMIDEAYEKRAWHGPNLKGSLRGLSAREASWRPNPNRHNIHEIAVHAAYWKYIVRRRLLGEKRGSFPLKGSNWFKRPDHATEREWRDDVALLDQAHRSLREAIALISPRTLHHTPAGSSTSNVMQIQGIAFHDVYHAGQIQFLKRLIPTE